MQFGIKDEEFIRGKVPMTKAEIRAMVMVKAAIQPGDIVADIGAGTGSLSIEAALCCPKGAVYSIERNTIAGTAPEAMEGLPKMDVIIIGGSSGNMHEILDRCEALLAPGGRIILTAVTVETTGEVVKEFADRPFELEGFEMQINRLRKLGRYHLYDPMSPIFIFTAIKN